MTEDQKTKYDDSIWETWSVDTVRTEQKINTNKNKKDKKKSK